MKTLAILIPTLHLQKVDTSVLIKKMKIQASNTSWPLELSWAGDSSVLLEAPCILSWRLPSSPGKNRTNSTWHSKSPHHGLQFPHFLLARSASSGQGGQMVYQAMPWGGSEAGHTPWGHGLVLSRASPFLRLEALGLSPSGETAESSSSMLMAALCSWPTTPNQLIIEKCWRKVCICTEHVQIFRSIFSKQSVTQIYIELTYVVIWGMNQQMEVLSI